MNVKPVNILLLFIVTILSWRAFAQMPSQGEIPAAEKLQDLVVTGTRTLKNLSDGPVKTDIISEQEIKESRYRDASQVIMDIPGLNLVDSTGKEGKSAIIQGLGAEHVLVLIDGAPILQNASSGVDLSQIPASEIQRVEVVKGGASALYGGQAMGGVINIITKAPTDKTQYQFEVGVDEPLEGKANHVLGYNVLQGNLRGKRGVNGFKLGVSHRKTTSIDRDDTSIARDTPDTDRLSTSAGLDHELTKDQKLQLDLGYGIERSRSYTSRMMPDTSFIATQTSGDIRRERVKLGYLGKPSETANLNTFVLLERTNDQLSMEDDPQTSEPENLKSSLFVRQRGEIQYDFSPAESHVLSLGFVAEKNALDQSTETRISAGNIHHSTEVDGKSSSTLESYVQDDWIFEKAELVTGLRLTHDPEFGNHLDPKANLLLKPDLFSEHKSVLRLSIGSGYRIPNLKERFYLLDHRSFAGYIVYGNDKLRPEESLSYQVGLEIQKEKSYVLHGNLFYNQVRGLITTIESPTGSSERHFRFENLNEARIYGFEGSASFELSAKAGLSSSFTYTKATQEPSGLIVPNRPFYNAQMAFRYGSASEESNTTLNIRYYGDSYANVENTEKYKAFTSVDLKYNHRFDVHTTGYIGLRNLLDEKRAPRLDSPDIVFDQRPGEGRMLVLGLSVEG